MYAVAPIPELEGPRTSHIALPRRRASLGHAMRSRRTAVDRAAGVRLLIDALRGLLLVVLNAGYLVPALHFTLIEHEICAEHGGLEHRDASAVHIERAVPNQSAALNAAASLEHEHEHCALLATSSQRLAIAVRSAIAVAPGGLPQQSFVSRAAFAHPSLDLLAYAPKLAPPA